MRSVLSVGLVVSLLLNVALGGLVVYLLLMGYAASPSGQLGVLTQEARVGRFEGTDTLFALPKGLVVRDASAAGADWFEPHRFTIVVTTEHNDLVRYPALGLTKDASEFYSADVDDRKGVTGANEQPQAAR